MRPFSSLEALERLYAERGDRTYGEDVTQIEHALQCAALAEAADAPPSLVAAALLHDLGHLLADETDPTAVDNRHEVAGARALAGLFDQAVRRPIALHVAAKRWLCLREPGYLAGLSAASRASLHLQGGAFTEAQAAAFERRAHWRQAVALRRWDDHGKDRARAGRTFADYLGLLQMLVGPARLD